MHATIPIKVNAVVDEAIAPLVLALNRDDRILTADSCQGGQDRPAYVFFRYAGPPDDEPGFVFRFASEIGRQVPPDVEYELNLEWKTGNTEPMAMLKTPPACIVRLAALIESAVNSGHTRRC